jgi:phospholipid/cholesterol/gamma-HCH transport system substrate-binding protein
MFQRPKRPIESYNKMWLGVVSVSVIAVVVGTIVGLGRLSLGQTGYSGEFAQAAQINAGDQVTVAGINVGGVTDVGLAGDHVVVKFKVRNDVHVGNASHAAIKLTTLLGRRYLELAPAGSGKLAGRTIALANTSVPYNLQEALADATTTFEQVDADRIAQSMTTLTNGLNGVPEALPQALANVKSLAAVISTRRDQIGSLLKSVDSITAMIHDQKANLGSLVIQGRDLLAEVVTRRQTVVRMLDSATALVNTIHRVIGDQPEINTMLDQLRDFSTMMAKHDELLRNTLQTTSVMFRNLANVSGSGTAFDIYLPAGIMIDSWMCAISKRGQQFNLAQYFDDCKPGPEPFPGWPPADPSRLPR